MPTKKKDATENSVYIELKEFLEEKGIKHGVTTRADGSKTITIPVPAEL